jgi:hypothetical protein
MKRTPRTNARRAALAALLTLTALTVTLVAATLDAAPSATPLAAAGDAGTNRISRTPPDPSPLVERAQWVFDLKYAKGDVYLLGVQRVDLGAPQATPRAMGRFAIELFEGPTLIERVRFDFPFMGAGDARLEAKLVTRIGVMFPVTSKGTRLELWDRATEQRWPLPWPPAPPPPSASQVTAVGGGDAARAMRDGG